MSEPQVRFVNFRTTVPASTAIVLEARSPITGKITHVTFHFPPGSISLVRVRVLLEREPVWPIGGEFIALDDATAVYSLHEGQKVKKDDYLQCEIENYDTVNPHTPSIILTLEGSPV